MFGNTPQDNPCLLKDVGVAQFNKQHLRLASYVVEFNQLVVGLQSREPSIQDWRHIDALWARVSSFVSQHFGEEEEEMARHEYPGYAKQKQQHDKFVSKLMKIQDQIRGRDGKFITTLDTLLWDWLQNHINEEDAQYREFFRARGVS